MNDATQNRNPPRKGSLRGTYTVSGTFGWSPVAPQKRSGYGGEGGHSTIPNNSNMTTSSLLALQDLSLIHI